MTIYIALLRGINVGGNNKLPMAELARELRDLGLQDVKTYIQSGNVLFRSDATDSAALAQRISAAIQARHGFAPHVLLLELGDLQQAVTANPFPDATTEPKSLHLFFLAETPASPDLALLDALRRENEHFSLADRIFYLHAPDGIGRSKLAEKVGKALNVPMTARNWRTVTTLLTMAEEVADAAA